MVAAEVIVAAETPKLEAYWYWDHFDGGPVSATIGNCDASVRAYPLGTEPPYCVLYVWEVAEKPRLPGSAHVSGRAASLEQALFAAKAAALSLQRPLA